MENKDKIMSLVREICNTSSTNCRSLNKADLAREIMDIANVPKEAEIYEIPLDWDEQVVILFLLPNDYNYYSLFSGKGNDGNFYFELSITGQLKENGKEFEFFEEEKELPLSYFVTRQTETREIV